MVQHPGSIYIIEIEAEFELLEGLTLREEYGGGDDFLDSGILFSSREFCAEELVKRSV